MEKDHDTRRTSIRFSVFLAAASTLVRRTLVAPSATWVGRPGPRPRSRSRPVGLI